MSKIIKMPTTKTKSKSHAGFLGLVLVVVTICFFLLSPIFEIDSIVVKGNEKVLEKYIISKSNICYGQNILRINKFDSADNIREIPEVKEVNIKRNWPSGIIIEVVEKVPACEVDFYGSKLLIAEDGIVLNVVTDGTIVDVPKLEGITVKDVIVGNDVICAEEEIIKKYLEVLKILKKNDIVNDVKKLTYNEGVFVHFKNGHVTFLGDIDNLEYKMLCLFGILEKETNPSYIDLSNAEKIITKPAWGMFPENNEITETDISNEVRGEEVEE